MGEMRHDNPTPLVDADRLVVGFANAIKKLRQTHNGEDSLSLSSSDQQERFGKILDGCRVRVPISEASSEQEGEWTVLWVKHDRDDASQYHVCVYQGLNAERVERIRMIPLSDLIDSNPGLIELPR